MKILEIRYWNSKCGDLPWDGTEDVKYDSDKLYQKGLKKILARIESASCNAMILNRVDGLLGCTNLLFIDNKRFRQS